MLVSAVEVAADSVFQSEASMEGNIMGLSDVLVRMRVSSTVRSLGHSIAWVLRGNAVLGSSDCSTSPSRIPARRDEQWLDEVGENATVGDTGMRTRFWNSTRQFLRTGSRFLISLLDDASVGRISTPGCNGRLFRSHPPSDEHRSFESVVPVSRVDYLEPWASDQRIVRVGGYTSLTSLRGLLAAVDRDVTLWRPTVVLVLTASFSGHLPTLIQRSNLARRLVLVVESGQVPLPGMVTLADLVARQEILGWRQIVFERDLEAAFTEVLKSLEKDEPLVILRPARPAASRSSA